MIDAAAPMAVACRSGCSWPGTRFVLRVCLARLVIASGCHGINLGRPAIVISS